MRDERRCNGTGGSNRKSDEIHPFFRRLQLKDMSDETPTLKDRIVSIDVLRGFSMFLILAIDIGGAPIFRTFTRLWGEGFAKAAAVQFSYGFAQGLRLCFIAQPLFHFVVGLVIPFSLSKRLLEKQKSKTNVYLHIVKRAVILFVLGEIAGGHLLHLQFAQMPLYNNVLEYLAIGYLVGAILVLNTSVLVQFIVTAALLVGYWAIFLFIRVPGWAGETFSREMNLAIYVDNIVLGAHHARGSWEVLATVNFVANVLIGVLVGQLLIRAATKQYKLKMLLGIGSAMLVGGFIWGFFFPVIRSLWSSSFVVETCGIATLLLALLFWLNDVLGYVKWAFFFMMFGVNSIAIYMMAHLFDFRLIGNIILGGLGRFWAPNVQDFVQACGAMVIMYLIVYYMYQKRTFIKI